MQLAYSPTSVPYSTATVTKGGSVSGSNKTGRVRLTMAARNSVVLPSPMSRLKSAPVTTPRAELQRYKLNSESNF
jgi:hypothetical protein